MEYKINVSGNCKYYIGLSPPETVRKWRSQLSAIVHGTVMLKGQYTL